MKRFDLSNHIYTRRILPYRHFACIDIFRLYYTFSVLDYPISGQVDRASATETVDLGSIPVGSNQRLQKLVCTASLLDVQQLKKQCEASTVCGKQVVRWQLDSKTERSLRCPPGQGNLVNKM